MDNTESLLQFMAWNTHDKKSILHKYDLFGVITLNKLSNEDFLQQLYDFSQLIINKVTVDHEQVIWKHDINNGILTPLQLNENLLSEKYELINNVRELLWQDNYEYLDGNETKQIFFYKT